MTNYEAVTLMIALTGLLINFITLNVAIFSLIKK